MQAAPTPDARAYLRRQATLAAVPPKALLRANLTYVRVALAVRSALPTLRSAIPACRAAVRGFDTATLATLADDASVLIHTATLLRVEPKLPIALAPLLAEAVSLRRLLGVYIAPLVAAGRLAADTVPRRARGRIKTTALAEELVVIAHRVKAAWRDIVGHTEITRALLARAATLGRHLFEAVAAQAMPTETWKRLVHAQRAAYTLIVQNYAEARAAYAFAMRGNRSALALVPPLYAAGFSRKAGRKEKKSTS